MITDLVSAAISLMDSGSGAGVPYCEGVGVPYCEGVGVSYCEGVGVPCGDRALRYFCEEEVGMRKGCEFEGVVSCSRSSSCRKELPVERNEELVEAKLALSEAAPAFRGVSCLRELTA